MRVNLSKSLSNVQILKEINLGVIVILLLELFYAVNDFMIPAGI